MIALVVGPVSAVIITLWYQRRSERRTAKRQLFVTLMAHRKAAPTPEWVSALNLIDVVYADDSQVVELWHRLYDTLTTQPFNNQQFGHQYINLLSAIAGSLGYRSLQQTDIDKFYAPQALGDQATLQVDLWRRRHHGAGDDGCNRASRPCPSRGASAYPTSQSAGTA